MLKELQQYLMAQGYENVYRDYMPSTGTTKKAINVTEWDNTVGSINDGTGTHYIQVQCRNPTYEGAYKTCHDIFTLLDSGTEETLINLTLDTFCIARPRRAPMILERDKDSGCVTFYCEITLWGDI